MRQLLCSFVSFTRRLFSIQKKKKFKPGLYYSSVEGWRGPVLIALDISAEGKILQSYVRDPSVLNWHALELAVRGELIGDFPLNNKSFNCLRINEESSQIKILTFFSSIATVNPLSHPV